MEAASHSLWARVHGLGLSSRTQTPERLFIQRRGSFSLEYAALLAIVAASLLGMAVYVKRALSSRWRDVGDTFGHGKQYEPCVTVVCDAAGCQPRDC